MNSTKMPGGTPAHIAVVDPYSMGARLAPEFRKYGVPCVMVQSMASIPHYFYDSFVREDYADVIVHRGDIVQTVRALAACGVQKVIAGHEIGVKLAGELGEAMGLLANGKARAEGWRHKYKMHQAVEAAGLPVPKQFCGDEVDELLRWVKAHGRWPVVTKPVESVGADGVQICFSEEEVRAACTAMLGQPNSIGLKNEEVLVQEFMSGPKYIVDMVSHGGQHCVAAMWRYTETEVDPRKVGIDGYEILPYEGEPQPEMLEQTRRILDALQLHDGPSHTEFVMTKKGVRLLEVGARLHGGHRWMTLAKQCTDRMMVEMAVAQVVDGESFLRRYSAPYTLHKHGMFLWEFLRKGEVVRDFPGLAEIQGMKSVLRTEYLPVPGMKMKETTSYALFVHPDKEVVREDCRRARKLLQEVQYEMHGLPQP